MERTIKMENDTCNKYGEQSVSYSAYKTLVEECKASQMYNMTDHPDLEEVLKASTVKPKTVDVLLGDSKDRGFIKVVFVDQWVQNTTTLWNSGVDFGLELHEFLDDIGASQA